MTKLTVSLLILCACICGCKRDNQITILALDCEFKIPNTYFVQPRETSVRFFSRDLTDLSEIVVEPRQDQEFSVFVVKEVDKYRAGHLDVEYLELSRPSV